MEKTDGLSIDFQLYNLGFTRPWKVVIWAKPK